MSLTIPAVVTRNVTSLSGTDWRSLHDFFKKPGATEQFISYCADKAGIPKEKSVEQEEKELTDEYTALEQRMNGLKKRKEESAKQAATETPVKK